MMKENLFLKFRKSGKIEDYLKYREEISKELTKEDVKQKTRDNSTYMLLSAGFFVMPFSFYADTVCHLNIRPNVDPR